MKATHIVHWPGHDTVACDLHTRRLLGAASVMGFRLSISPLDPLVECINCVNEEAKRPAFAQLCSDAEPAAPRRKEPL